MAIVFKKEKKSFNINLAKFIAICDPPRQVTDLSASFYFHTKEQTGTPIL